VHTLKNITIVLLLLSYSILCPAQVYDWVLPTTDGWTNVKEDQEISFVANTNAALPTRFTIEGIEGLGIAFDSAGNFKWRPSFDLVDRVTKMKDYTIIFQATIANGQRLRKAVTFSLAHVNRPPIVEELPSFYVKQASLNTYQLSSDYVYDPDGDPIVFKTIPSQMPEESSLSSQGQWLWKPSRGQFNALKNNALTVEFIVQDQPDKAETKGRLRIAQTQQDLPPEILVVPGDSLFIIKEDETINLKLYISDPNGDDNILSAGFVSNDLRISQNALKENTTLQYEFIWMPGYTFVQEERNAINADITFFALDKSNNRAQKKIRIKINDAENLVEKDALQYQKYVNNLISATQLIGVLDANQKKLNNDYKKARKGKKHRSIVNASLGGITGISPLALDPDNAKLVSGIGGTTVLTLGTLEATEVIGRSKEAILEKIKINIEIRNKVQAVGDEFAKKYALKSSRRQQEFDKDIEKLRTAMNDQKLVLLEIDAYQSTAKAVQRNLIKQVFIDFSDE
jgi:hypothetical protein